MMTEEAMERAAREDPDAQSLSPWMRRQFGMCGQRRKRED
jgi:hypothetical protein